MVKTMTFYFFLIHNTIKHAKPQFPVIRHFAPDLFPSNPISPH